MAVALHRRTHQEAVAFLDNTLHVARFEALARPGQAVTVIGDAVRAGKSKQAIASAFEAALLR